MKVCIAVLLLVASLHTASSEYRFKLRGPPGPPRPPPVPQYAKKWHNPSRGPPPNRHRPIPIHMPAPYKIPMGIPAAHRPVAPPVRTFWKNTQANFRPPPEKPFLSSPPITKEFDYHVQTNSIPTHTNPIKQVGEKGPIHTIPAPNLSPADKPAVVEEFRKEVQQQQYAHIIQNRPEQLQQQQQQLQQYQVTEYNEPIYANNLQQSRAPQIYFHQDISGMEAQTSAHKAEAAALQQHHLQLQSSPILEQQLAIQQGGLYKNQINQQLSEIQIPSGEIYQILNLNSQQQHLLDPYKLQLEPQPQAQQQFLQQQIPDYQALINAQHNDKQEGSFSEQIEHLRQPAQSQEVHPEYHSFNYEEQNQRSAQIPDGVSVVADYNLEPAADSSEIIHSTIARNQDDAVAQAQYIQQYFGNRDEDASENHVEPDAKKENSLGDSTQSDVINSAFYATLPSRQAAEALASLQAAGKINTNVKHNQQRQNVEAQQKTPLTIYIPDGAQGAEVHQQTDLEKDMQYSSNNNYGFDESKENDYEEFGERTQSKPAGNRESDAIYGNRIKPKRNH